ncbi:Uncharacterized protein PRO82_000908 [Candidatus Protochlamydia amoebophila]|uniref:hypothetical protein n=1 Tax=Candidatus Protochlamydia amoebophila TaxID=362787 RepID=UPI001BC8F5C4|nr:hypothetical protein [Candidatus Protochlamydia amoebophila]MBS4163605.1 Uncharacterized protein [Candidatus Protochlamydia amoebophila]
MNMPPIGRKTKIVLSDYPYKRDIENRLLLSHLSILEVKILQEILHSSLKISIKELAEELEISSPILISHLDKLSATKLFKRNELTLIVDKEVRKYFEIQLEKFEEDFEPNLEFLQSLLNKVPIHVLPVWYAIPRSSDHIFSSIIEKYFQTPKMYREYLGDLQFEDPILKEIMKDVYEAPDFTITAVALIDKYKLSREKFEESLLLLEYYFVCCLRYKKVGEYWEEIVTPFHEYHEYLLVKAQNTPKTIADKSTIQHTLSTEFGYIREVETILSNCKNKKELHLLSMNYLSDSTEFKSLIDKLVYFGFLKKIQDMVVATEKGMLWLKRPPIAQMTSLAWDWLSEPFEADDLSIYWNPRNFRLIEKYLKQFKYHDWVYLEDFIKSFMGPMGDRGPINLVNKGKKWKYALPVYQSEELNFIREVITKTLFQLGIVSTGIHQNQVCFTVTAFGHQFIH